MWCARLHSSSPAFTSPFLIYIHPKAALRLSCQPGLLCVAPGSAWESSLRIQHFPGYLEEGSLATAGSLLQENPMKTPPSYPLKPSATFGSRTLWFQGLSSPPVMAHHCFLPLHFSNYFSNPHKHLASTTPNGKETSR